MLATEVILHLFEERLAPYVLEAKPKVTLWFCEVLCFHGLTAAGGFVHKAEL